MALVVHYGWVGGALCIGGKGVLVLAHFGQALEVA